MKLKTLNIQNFLSVRNVELNLEDRGLILVSGKNRDSGNFDSNGSGKSTLFEGLTYAIYGKTLRGLKADEVIHKKPNKNCKVMLDFEDDDGTPYRIARYRKHSENKNSSLVYRNGKNITPKSEKDTNDFLVDLFQMDFLTFTSSIVYSEQSFKFTSATDTEMKKAFDTMLGLDILTMCQGEAKTEVSTISTSLDKTQLKLDKDKDTLDQLEEQWNDILEEEKEHKKQMKSKISKARNSVKECETELNEVTNHGRDFKQELKELSEVNDKLKEKKESYATLNQEKSDVSATIKTTESEIKLKAKELKTNSKDVKKIEDKINKIKGTQKDLLKQVESIGKTQGQPCPTCGSPLTEEHVEEAQDVIYDKMEALQEEVDEHKAEVKELKAESGSLSESMEDLEDELDSLESRLVEIGKELEGQEELDEEIEEVQEDIWKVKTDEKQVDKDIEHKQQMLDNAKQHLEDLLQQRDDTYKGIKDSITKQKNSLHKGIKEQEKTLEDLNNKKAMYEFWVKAFGNQGIKSYLLDDVTPFLNRRVNKYLQALTNGSIEVEFSTQTTLKSGEKRDKFSLDIKNKIGGPTYNSNSGGERKRVDLAVNMALQDLVASRSNKRLNLVFYDEVFDALDDTGSQKVVEMLQESASNKSSIFVITHSESLKPYFSEIMTVVKENGYTRLEV